MVDVRGDVLRPPHGLQGSSFKSNENIHKKEESYYVVSGLISDPVNPVTKAMEIFCNFANIK